MTRTRTFQWVIHLFPLALALGLVFQRFQPIHGLVGHDYAHYYARLLIGVAHFWQNGLAVPHFTPYLCGGVPYFADPQIYYYSFPQLLAFFVSPWFATYFSYLLFYIAGYCGMFQLARHFSCRSKVAHLSALAFVLNGFSFVHLFVGHANHYQFLSIPWLVYLMLKEQRPFSLPWIRAVSLFSLICIYIFYSGALHILVLAAGTLFLFLPYLISERRTWKQLRGIFYFFVCITLVLVCTCSGKFIASSLYSKQFEFHGIDRTALTPGELFVRYLWFNPFDLPHFLPFSGWAFGSWEYVGFVTKLTLPALGLLGFHLIFRHNQDRLRLYFITALCSGLLICLASGAAFNEYLPFFNHYHNPLKLMGAFIVPLLLIFGLAMERLTRLGWFRDSGNVWRMGVFYSLAGFLICEFGLYSLVWLSHPAALGFQYDGEPFQRVRELHHLPPVQRITEGSRVDFKSMNAGESSLSCYEPLFGYRLEKFRAGLTLGAISQTSAGAYNLTHPACLVYGAELACQPWDRISISEQKQLVQFAQGSGPTEWIPSWQTGLLSFNALSVLLLFIPLIWPNQLFFTVPLLKRVRLT